MAWMRKGNYVYWENERGLPFVLGARGYLVVLLYLSACLIAGTFLSVCSIYATDQSPAISPHHLLCLYFPALAGSSIFYLRRMYHIAFNGRGLKEDEVGTYEWVRVGTYVYFFSRPIIVSMAALIMLLAAAVGVSSLLVGMFKIEMQGFAVLAVLAALLGYGGGRSINDLSSLSSSIGRKLFG